MLVLKLLALLYCKWRTLQTHSYYAHNTMDTLLTVFYRWEQWAARKERIYAVLQNTLITSYNS